MIRLSQLGILTESTEFNQFLVKSLPKMVSGIGLSARGVEADMIWLSVPDLANTLNHGCNGFGCMLIHMCCLLFVFFEANGVFIIFEFSNCLFGYSNGKH